MKSKYQVVERCVLRWGEYGLPNPKENQMEFVRAMIAEGHLPEGQNLRSAATMVRKALRQEEPTDDGGPGPFQSASKRHYYDRDHDVYTFFPPKKAAFKAPGPVFREMKQCYSNPPNGLGWTINKVCKHFKINRAKFVFMKTEMGWTHDQDEFTREEHIDPEFGVEEMLDDREQRSRWALEQLARERERKQLQKQAALGVDYTQQLAAARAALGDLETFSAPEQPTEEDRLVVYPLADYHFEKTVKGDRDKWQTLFRQMSKVTKGSKALVVVQGDFFHRDTVEGTTSRGTNLRMNVDKDPSPQMKSAYSGLLTFLRAAAEQHSWVDVLIIRGNHDEHSTMHLQAAFTVLLENLGIKAQIVDPSWDPIKTYQYGEALLVFDHGDSGRGKAEKMLTKTLDDLRGSGVYDSTRRTFLFTGHLHHEIVKAVGQTKCFQLPSPSETDRYHEKSCYGAFREIVAYEFDPFELHVRTVYQEVT